jgi:hypothetical protein
MRPIAPITPPTTEAALSRGLEEIPAVVCDSGWSEVDVGEEFRTVLDGTWNPLPLWFPDTIVGEVCKSLCATTIAAVLDEVVGVIPFDAGNAVALMIDAFVVDVDVLTTAADDVVTAIEVVPATEEAAAALNEEDTPPATFG